MKKNTLVIFVFLIMRTFYAFSMYNDLELVTHIAELLLVNYDKKEVNSVTDRIIHNLSRKSYAKMLILWQQNFRDISSIKVEIDPFVKQIIKTIRKHVSPDEAERFQTRFEELMHLTLENFNLYYTAVKEKGPQPELNTITCDYIDSALLNHKYYYIQLDLYEKEVRLTNNLRAMMLNPKVKHRLALHRFGQELLVKYRQKTITNLLSSYDSILH